MVMKHYKCPKHQNYKYVRFCPFCLVTQERDVLIGALKYIARGPRPDDSDSAVAKKALSDIGIDDSPADDPWRHSEDKGEG